MTEAVPLTPPAMKREAERVAELKRMKRNATGLLVVVAAAFVAAVLLTDDHGGGGYLRAALEASMVGGLADWFAVTALFRHPLGLPIPHTAVVAERKDQFGATLGAFVQEQFLSPEILGEKVRNVGVSRRLAAWGGDHGNASRAAGHVADLAVRGADIVNDADVHALIEGAIRTRVDATPAAPLAGRLLKILIDEGRHREVVDAVLRGLATFLEQNEENLRERFTGQTPWWVPGPVEDRVFDRFFDRIRAVLRGADAGAGAPDDLRKQIDQFVEDLAFRLEHDPALLARGEEIKRDLLAHPALREWTAALWREAKTTLRAQAADPNSELRTRLAGALVAAANQLRDDPKLAKTIDDAAENAARTVADQFQAEIAGLVSGTIARWDGEETSHRLELLLGPDLQFIRINGTVVGGLAGLAIHAVAQLLH